MNYAPLAFFALALFWFFLGQWSWQVQQRRGLGTKSAEKLGWTNEFLFILSIGSALMALISAFL